MTSVVRYPYDAWTGHVCTQAGNTTPKKVSTGPGFAPGTGCSMHLARGQVQRMGQDPPSQEERDIRRSPWYQQKWHLLRVLLPALPRWRDPLPSVMPTQKHVQSGLPNGPLHPPRGKGRKRLHLVSLCEGRSSRAKDAVGSGPLRLERRPCTAS